MLGLSGLLVRSGTGSEGMGEAFISVDIFEPSNLVCTTCGKTVDPKSMSGEWHTVSAAILCGPVDKVYEAVTLISPVVPCQVADHVNAGYADYMWRDCNGRVVQVERKQWGEVLSGLDRIEDQLRRHRQNQPDARLSLLIEGLVVSQPSGTYPLRETNNGAVWVRDHKSGTEMSRVLPWLYNLSEYVEVYQTSSYIMTCQFLVSAFKQDQKPEKGTFQRYFKQIKFHENPQITRVMGFHPGLGEVKATALINHFVTFWAMISSSPEEMMKVPGIGAKLAVDILRQAGRLDV